MPLTITDYKNWALQNQSSTVSLNDRADGLAKESARIGRFTRAFSKSTINGLRGAVMKDFARALGSRYGASIAKQALAAAGLTAKSQLKGLKISLVINTAKNLRAQMLRPEGGRKPPPRRHRGPRGGRHALPVLSLIPIS